MQHRLSPAATRDIARIYRQSVLTFGSAQADRYLAGLDDTFTRIALSPEAASERTEFRGKVRVRRFQSHYIIYRLVRDEVVITRVLHTHQDIVRYL